MATQTTLTRGPKNPRKNSGGPGARGAKKFNGGRIPIAIATLARNYTEEGVKHLARIMRDETAPAMSRIAAIKILFDRGWGKASETHNIDINGETSLLKVVNEIVHVHETREQIEFRDQTPLLELAPEDSDDPNGPKKTH